MKKGSYPDSGNSPLFGLAQGFASRSPDPLGTSPGGSPVARRRAPLHYGDLRGETHRRRESVSRKGEKSLRTAISLVFAVTVVLLAAGLAARENTYVGASACKLCHKAELQGRQYVIWESNLHSKAYANLKTPKAAEIGRAAGVANPAENAQCLGCHAPLAAKAPELKEEGVTCEVCHGPGSAYKKLNIMMDRQKAAQNGLVLYNADPSAIQAHCLKCHQNPHGNPFDFGAAWDKVKHPIPGK